mmetsp:Transcript_69512/g.217056  ORF Transcript_69512/g.217056 Transcript_69512/m.217056 type:complete len:311 (-) Transcript_69512:411-1343(-)
MRKGAQPRTHGDIRARKHAHNPVDATKIQPRGAALHLPLLLPLDAGNLALLLALSAEHLGSDGLLDLFAQVAIGDRVLQQLHLTILDQCLHEDPLLERLVHQIHPQQVIDALVERLRLRVVVHCGPLEKVESVNVDWHHGVRPVPGKPVDGQDATGGVFPCFEAKGGLHVRDVLGIQPTQGGAKHELESLCNLSVDEHPEEKVGPGNHHTVHEERQCHASPRHRVLRVGGVEHAVGEVDGRLGTDPGLQARDLCLEVVEPHHLIHGVDRDTQRVARGQTRPVAKNNDLRAFELLGALRAVEEAVRALLPR